MNSRLGLITREYQYEFTIKHFKKPQEDIVVATDFETITGITLPNGVAYNNRRHSSSLNLLKLMRAHRNTSESITLPDEKADRLVSLFRRLKPGHGLQCHDVFAEVELWPDILDLDYSARILAEDEQIIPGMPYSIHSDFGSEEWAYTHSCLGTDNGNLLGLVGNGMMMAVMDRKNTEKLYARGGTPYLAAMTNSSISGPPTLQIPSRNITIILGN